jgi:adenylyl-sulfate kinase
MQRDAKVRKGGVVWLTGLPASGKSTIATHAHRVLQTLGIPARIVDGDVLRHTICRDLGYSDADRCENIRRAGELALSHAQAGCIALVALISPFEQARRAVEARCVEARVPFAVVWINASLTCCEERDPKGLYRLARAGTLPSFTGISSPYEPPSHPTLVVHTDRESEPQSTERVASLALTMVHLDPSFWVVL